MQPATCVESTGDLQEQHRQESAQRWPDVASARAPRDLRPNNVGAVGVGDAAQWAAVTVASGIVGSLAYDTLKHYVWRGKRFASADTQNDHTLLLAKFAVIARCADLGMFDVPVKLNLLRVRSVTRDESGRTEFYLVAQWMEARVVIPGGRLTGHEIEVTLYNAR